MNLRETISAASRAKNETNDCAVRAVAVVTGLPYDEIHWKFYKRGRKPRRGVRNSVTYSVVKALGYKFVPYTAQAKTVVTLKRELPLWGSFLVLTNGHIVGIRDRKVIDWAVTSRKRVKAVWRITKCSQRNN